MGDRGQVLVKKDDKDSGVYLYTHWGASGLIEDVRKALAKRWRWNDTLYLTRIIFDVMTENDHDSETGFGIGTKEAGDAWRTITINVAKQTVQINDGLGTWSFEAFVDSSF